MSAKMKDYFNVGGAGVAKPMPTEEKHWTPPYGGLAPEHGDNGYEPISYPGGGGDGYKAGISGVKLTSQGAGIPSLVEPVYRTYPEKQVQYRYDEGKHLDELRAYVDSTYGAHYTTKESEIQAIDAFKALGSLFTTSRDLAMKYLWRVRKKGTKADAKKDLMKVMHYTLFMLHCLENEKE